MKKPVNFLLSVLFLMGTVVAVAQNSDAFNTEEFVQEAASGGLMEVQLGEMAMQKASSDEVKEFGSRMVEDHSQANKDLMELAQVKQYTVPMTLMDQHQKIIDKLSGLSGEEFDKEYMKVMVEDHRKEIQKFENAVANADNPELKAWAEKTLTVLEEHHQLAEETHDVALEP